ncbi:hypothetical protein CQW23_02910 [Capsicum baccatum]|uniref:NB-ARC domain-containing protein n=1 Tax=Capsicum baccatum TaxID=33114 RepID=A0A2G2XSS7_CAPBA|nr:hypothetical protein CQW23_02910 [Capsicum baccatum]
MEVVKTCGEGTLSSEVYSTRHSFTSIDVDEVASFEKDTKNIMKKLTGGTKELDVLSIFGMPGTKKTTLARKVYNNLSLVNYVDAKSWYDILQEYNRRTLLVEIFKQVKVDKNKIKEDVDIADELQKTLKGKRYLIVLYDIWEVRAWEDLGLCFPKGKNGCRVMMAVEYVLNVDKEDMEEAFTIFLFDLLNIILVMVSHGSSNAGVTYCTLHDVVHHAEYQLDKIPMLESKETKCFGECPV